MLSRGSLIITCRWGAMAVVGLLLAMRGVIVAGERVETVNGEVLAVSQGTVADRILTVELSGQPPRQFPLRDVIEYGRFAEREMGDLKTRFVRIEHSPGTTTSLSLAEVLVFEADKNVAMEGQASQSGVDRDGHPERAIDGNTNGVFEMGRSTTLTPLVDAPWWEVDLKRDVKVRQIEVWNRTDEGEGKKLKGTRLVLLDAERRPLWVDTISKAPAHRKTFKVPQRGADFKQFDLKEYDNYTGHVVVSKSPPLPDELHFGLVGGGACSGQLSRWSSESLTIELSALGQTALLQVPRPYVREIWSPAVESGKVTVAREGEAVDVDHVYVRNDKNEVIRVSGIVLGREADTLQIEIDGQARKIGWKKILGVVLHPTWSSNDDTPFERVQLSGGHLIPGRCRLLTSDGIEMETLWGEQLTLPRSNFVRLTVQNGRLRSLLSQTPVHVEQVGYLDLVRPYQVNRSFSGEPLQVGDQTFTEGICAHSRTVLDYELSDRFHQFRCHVGLQNGDGDRGHVIARVLVNGEIRWQAAIVGKEAAIPVTVDLKGGETLRLEVDFGEGFDAADHVVWGNPQLILN